MRFFDVICNCTCCVVYFYFYPITSNSVFASAVPYGPGIMRISSSADCAAVGGSCGASADCDLSKNVFVGRCDDASLGCCIDKDDVCKAKEGECLSEADCSAKSDSHATGLACSTGVCCVTNSASGYGRNGVTPGQGQGYANNNGGQGNQRSRGGRGGHGGHGRGHGRHH